MLITAEGVTRLYSMHRSLPGRASSTVPGELATGAGPADTPHYHKTTLANGVRVVTGPMSGVRSASLIFYYNVGSRVERPEIAGVSHFLEHMLFKGTERRPDPLMISEEIEQVGGMLNAATGRESTSYWCKVPSTHTAMAFDVMADMLRGSVFDPAEIDKERKVVFEEIRSVQDVPEDLVHDLTDALVWGDDALGRDIAGTIASVGNIDRVAMVDFWQRNYGPERLVIAAGGDIDHDEIVRLAEANFGDLRGEGADVATPVAVTQDASRLRVVNRPTEQAHLCISVPAISYRDERRHAQAMIDSILSSGMSSRLFQEIRERRGLVYSVFGYFRGYEDVGQGVVYAGTDIDRAEEATDAILGELRKLRDIRVSNEEMHRNKELRKGRLLMGLEDSRSVASWVGSQEATYGEIKTPEQVMEEIDAVTADQVQELAQELFLDERLNMVLIGPYEDPTPFAPHLTFGERTTE